jgi:hypothetical protein
VAVGHVVIPWFVFVVARRTVAAHAVVAASTTPVTLGHVHPTTTLMRSPHPSQW